MRSWRFNLRAGAVVTVAVWAGLVVFACPVLEPLINGEPGPERYFTPLWSLGTQYAYATPDLRVLVPGYGAAALLCGLLVGALAGCGRSRQAEPRRPLEPSEAIAMLRGEK